MNKLELAIVGHGFVGAAVDYGFPDNNCNKKIIDPKYGNSIEDLAGHEVKATFICVPTPMGQDASIDASILIDTVQKVAKYTTGLIVIKSTVIPSIIDELSKLSKRIVYNPEFLTEASANQDFVNPTMHVFGGNTDATDYLGYLYLQFSSCKPCPVYNVTHAEAAFIKYGMNGFLASKVLWFNQFHDIINKYGSNYSAIMNAIGTDPRIGSSHTMVPGHDGRKGYGSACFAKDVPAFINFAKEQGVDLSVMREVAIRNQEIRNSYDDVLPREWEQHVRFDYDI
jgi:UDPglucose 6-dehydrogenase